MADLKDKMAKLFNEYAQAQNSFIEQDRTIKRRFTISCRSEKRKFSFESVLDCDHAEWFHSIQTNIEVAFIESTYFLEFRRRRRF